MTHESIANIPEGRFVDHLLSHRYWRSAILNIAGIPEAPLDFQRVSLADAPGGFIGDVDILLCSNDQPALAMAIEAKRVKVGPEAFRTGTPNKLQEYQKAVRQANRLAQVGFSQVYVFVLVVVDSREHNDGRITYAGVTPALHGVIDSAISLNGLDQRIGLARHDFIQPMDHAPLGIGAGGTHLIRPARPVAQPIALTEWITRLVERRAA